MQRSYVEQGDLVYSCNCGWIDTGHANPTSRTFGIGAQSLWQQITSQNGQASKAEDGFKVVYRQRMAASKFGITMSAGVGGDFFVARGLSRKEQESVALGIFLYVSNKFEDLQGSFPYGIITGASSFSIEDLVSNLIGFFEVVRGVSLRGQCKPVSKPASLQVFDTYKDQINRTRTATASPTFFPCAECKGNPIFPNVFRSINVLSPKMRGNVINLQLQYGSKSRAWLPVDAGLVRL